jgi:hypothetical protein
MKKSINGGRKKMEIQKHNKPTERIRIGRISLLRWENSNGDGEAFISFSINKTVMKRKEDDPSRFEGQVFSLNGLTSYDLAAIKEAVTEMEEKYEVEGWSQ